MTPALASYQMGYCAPLDPHRVEAFLMGKLSSCQELVLFAQDVIEAGQVHSRGPRVFNLVKFFVEQSLCTITGSYRQ